jgi:citrate synthase
MVTWISATEALRRLGGKPQSLYASVSRGRIKARPDPADSRRSLYSAVDVDRLAQRQTGRRKSETVAGEALRWGEPVLPSAISTIAVGRLIYRGHDATVLAETATLEETAQVLWPIAQLALPAVDAGAAGWPGLLTAMARRTAIDLPTLGRRRAALATDAASVLATVVASLAGPGIGGQAIHQRLASHWNRPGAADDLRRALVLLADHELNASTFAVRVAASTGASLAAAVLAGLATLSGPLHGTAAAALQPVVAAVAAQGVEATVRTALEQGRPIPGFGHPLYPQGDVRATALLAGMSVPPEFADLRSAVETLVGEEPNIDFALAAMMAIHRLPPDAPLVVFALARSVGWLAHGIEQVETTFLLRPRARYVGPPAAP